MPSVRWTPRANLHVTLRFLGDASVSATAAALDGLVASAATAVVGPATERLGRGVLMVPVAGLDAVAAAVSAVLPSEDPRPFVGHITVGRARGRRGVVPPAAAGAPVGGSFPVDEVTLVRSRGGRYDVVGRWVLGTNTRSEYGL
jgi:2'-5' RNA ligase